MDKFFEVKLLKNIIELYERIYEIPSQVFMFLPQEEAQKKVTNSDDYFNWCLYLGMLAGHECIFKEDKPNEDCKGV